MTPIFIVYNDLGLGGIQKKIVDIVNFIGRTKPEVFVYLILRRRESFDISKDLFNKKLKVFYYSDQIKIKIPFFFNVFLFYLTWRLKPKAMLSFLPPYTFSVILMKIIFFWRKIRVVVSADCYTSGIVPSIGNPIIISWAIRHFYPLADEIISMTVATKNDLVKTYGLSDKNIRIIRNWTNIVDNKERRATNKIYDLIYIGRLAKTKNLDFLLDGLLKLRKYSEDIKLCLIGDGDDKERLTRLVKDKGLAKNVEFLGIKRNVRDFMNKAKIFVYSSYFNVEGFPLAILEAMSLGIPVLSRCFAGLSEIVRDGRNGFSFATSDEFVKKALLILTHSEETKDVILKARADIKKNYSTDNIKYYLSALKI